MSNDREAAFLRLQEERLSALERRRADRKEASHPVEQIAAFQQQFAALRAAIEADLTSLSALPGDAEKRARLSEVQSRVGSLQTLLNDSMTFLTAHEIRRGQDGVTAVHEAVARAQQECLPKKKFAFGAKKKKAAAPAVPAAEEKLVQGKEEEEDRFAKYPGDVIVTDRTGEDLVIPRADTQGKDVLLRNLSHCTVTLAGVLGTLHATNCTNCTFTVGPISGSLFLERCSNSTFNVTCQQARIHSTEDATFLIHVTSKAIIEDCKGLKFGERKEGYEGYEKDLEESGLGAANNWSQIDDFNWLSKEHSPNWTTI